MRHQNSTPKRLALLTGWLVLAAWTAPCFAADSAAPKAATKLDTRRLIEEDMKMAAEEARRLDPGLLASVRKQLDEARQEIERERRLASRMRLLKTAAFAALTVLALFTILRPPRFVRNRQEPSSQRG